jgi:hypothetical protein
MKIAESESESGSISKRHGSADPDRHQNVMDPEHCFNGYDFSSDYRIALSISTI